jgi:hypothetical protein
MAMKKKLGRFLESLALAHRSGLSALPRTPEPNIDFQTGGTRDPEAKEACATGVYFCAAPAASQFTVTVGTVLERSHVPLSKWLMALFLLCSSKKSLSANQVHRMIGVTYKTAWFMCHRIRFGMTPQSLGRTQAQGHGGSGRNVRGPQGQAENSPWSR